MAIRKHDNENGRNNNSEFIICSHVICITCYISLAPPFKESSCRHLILTKLCASRFFCFLCLIVCCCFIYFQGFDEYMNVVLDDACEINTKTSERTAIGNCVFYGSFIEAGLYIPTIYNPILYVNVSVLTLSLSYYVVLVNGRPNNA